MTLGVIAVFPATVDLAFQLGGKLVQASGAQVLNSGSDVLDALALAMLAFAMFATVAVPSDDLLHFLGQGLRLLALAGLAKLRDLSALLADPSFQLVRLGAFVTIAMILIFAMLGSVLGNHAANFGDDFQRFLVFARLSQVADALFLFLDPVFQFTIQGVVALAFVSFSIPVSVLFAIPVTAWSVALSFTGLVAFAIRVRPFAVTLGFQLFRNLQGFSLGRFRGVRLALFSQRLGFLQQFQSDGAELFR